MAQFHCIAVSLRPIVRLDDAAGVEPRLILVVAGMMASPERVGGRPAHAFRTGTGALGWLVTANGAEDDRPYQASPRSEPSGGLAPEVGGIFMDSWVRGRMAPGLRLSIVHVICT